MLWVRPFSNWLNFSLSSILKSILDVDVGRLMIPRNQIPEEERRKEERFHGEIPFTDTTLL